MPLIVHDALWCCLRHLIGTATGFSMVENFTLASDPLPRYREGDRGILFAFGVIF